MQQLPKQLFDGLVDLLKIFQLSERFINIIHASEIEEMQEQLFELILTIVEFESKAPRAFNTQVAEFKNKILSTNIFHKIRLVIPEDSVAQRFLSQLKTSLTTTLQAQLSFCLSLKRIIKDEFMNENSDYGYSGPVVIDYLKKRALPEKVKEVRKPSFTSQGGENSAQLSGIPGDTRGHWFSAGPPVTALEPIAVMAAHAARQFPPGVVAVFRQHFENECNHLDNDGTLPTQILDVQHIEGERYQFHPRDIQGPIQIQRAFLALLLREVDANRIHTVPEARTFTINYLQNHPNVLNNMFQVAGQGIETPASRAIIFGILNRVITQLVQHQKIQVQADPNPPAP